jgi:hypothetical protein
VSFTLRPLYPGTHWIGDWVGPKAGLNVAEKRKILRGSNSDPSVVQPAASRYTDCAIPAPKKKGKRAKRDLKRAEQEGADCCIRLRKGPSSGF